MTDLGLPDGDACGGANAINSREQVVGLSFHTCSETTQHAWLLNGQFSTSVVFWM
jgi:hypothetical protein